MSAGQAREYAELVATGFRAQYDDGHAFGLSDCRECGASPDESCRHDAEREPRTAWDFLADDALDITYRIGSDGEYQSAEIMISFGGPNAWVDTDSNDLVVYWSGRATWCLPADMVRELDEAASESWDSVR